MAVLLETNTLYDGNKAASVQGTKKGAAPKKTATPKQSSQAEKIQEEINNLKQSNAFLENVKAKNPNNKGFIDYCDQQIKVNKERIKQLQSQLPTAYVDTKPDDATAEFIA